jgi:signal transduction histidine kinase
MPQPGAAPRRAADPFALARGHMPAGRRFGAAEAATIAAMWVFAALGCVLLASALLLRRRPLTALIATLGGWVIIGTLELPPPGGLQIVLAGAAAIEICYVAATRTRAVSVTGTVIVCAVVLSPGRGKLDLIQLRGGNMVPAVVLVTIIAWLIGNSIRQAQAQAELLRAQATAQTVMAERLRIARDLHDIVAHSIGIIAIQAGAGRRVFDASPAEARDALAAIEATSRETLSGLRRMVTALRRAERQQASLNPAVGLADVERLAAMTLDAGVRVDVDWHGSREPLPADIDLSAFRIIQEAVTNVVRHAGADHCRVSIDQRDGQVSIEVTDGGRGGGVAGTGYGITGMRERAELLGGDFSAGPRPGGFRVAARLPVPTSPR